MEQKGDKKMGWEIAREVEATKTTMGERAKITGEQAKKLIKYLVLFGILFAIGCWLAGNPFDFTKRISSEFVTARGWEGTDNWTIIWWVVALCAFLEWMDSAGGMGYGTILTPVMFLLGFDPRQVVPQIMITEMVTGLMSGFVHGDFQNVEWKIRPMNETTKLVTMVSITGIIATMVSISAVYAIFTVHKFWIKFYVAVLLLLMGGTSLFTAIGHFSYKPKLMWMFAFVGGFNKGVGGGGYGPVITIGGLLSGVPVKSMVAITSLAEGVTCLGGVIMWFFIGFTGVEVDYMLLPSFVIGTIVAALFAPWTTRVIPEWFWKWAIPVKACGIGAYTFYKIWPDIQTRFFG